jgi:diguanylate cyclase (GGDEF)-like protein/PAS domain S-box-containing protein
MRCFVARFLVASPMFKEVHVEDIESRAGAPQIAALLAQYRLLSSDSTLPGYADFNPERLAEHASNLAVVEPIGSGDYLYVYYGRTIFETSGVEMLGSTVSQWKSEVGAFFCQAYDRAIAELRPIYTVHRAHHAIRVHLWERLVLPVRAEDGSLRLVVFNKPREYLDDLLRAVLDASPDGVLGLRCVRNADGHIEDAMVITANQRAADIIGCTVENLIDHPILEVIPKLRGTKTWARYLEVVETRQPQRFELTLRHGGDPKWFDVKVVPLGDGFILSVTDITSLKSANRELEVKNLDLAKANALLGEEVNRRKELENELRRLANIDLLTGVATRRAFVTASQRALSIASERRQPLAAIALDIDHFKAINDRYGHLAGDMVLTAVGEELRRECRSPDVVGRLGGEEFAILLANTSLDTAAGIAERVRQRLLTAVVSISEATQLTVTASLGVAAFAPRDTYEDLIGRADAGLYRAKRAGRNCVVVVQSSDNAGDSASYAA